VIGLVWAIVELVQGQTFGTGDEPITPTPAVDQTAGPGVGFGRIIRPDGLTLPSDLAGASPVDDWKVTRFTASDGRVYDSVVSRPAQVWWAPRTSAPSPDGTESPSHVEGSGWSGRWGPRVTNDPFNRRAGGKCPDFLGLFLEEVARVLSGP